MAKFTQNFRIDCILVHSQKNNVISYASRYLKITAEEIAQRLMWLRRQPDNYKRRIDASVRLMDMNVKAKKVAYE